MKNILKFKTLVSLILLCCSAVVMQAQTSTEKNEIPLRISIYGENGVHPGLKVGTSHFLHKNVKVRTRKFKFRQEKKGSKTKVIQYKLDGNLGFYNHPNNHFGLFLGTGITRSKNKNESSLTTAWSLEVNYLRRFYNIETFEIDENGNINELGAAGNGGLMFALAPSIERRFGKGQTSFFMKPSFQVVKYNHSYAPNAALELGITLNLSK